MEVKEKKPNIKWAQRKDRLFVTIEVIHSKQPVIDIIDGKRIKYSGSDATMNYSVDIELYDEVVKEESKFLLDSRFVLLNLKKKTSGPFWPRLIKEAIKEKWISVDWKYFVDEDEEDEKSVPQPNFEGQDFGDMDIPDDEDNIPQAEDKDKDVEMKDIEKTEGKQPDLSDLDKEEKK